MNPGSVQTMYRLRRAGQIAALVTPIVVLGGAYLLVTQVWMAPAVPGAETAPEAVLRFIVHDRGLPRLSRAGFEAFLDTQLRRLARDKAFHERFFAEVRTASPDEQKAFREHLFDAFLPIMLGDIRRLDALPECDRSTFLDERIVAYNRFNGLRVSKTDLGSAALSPAEMLKFLTERTTQRDRELGMAFIAAFQARVAEILVDPELKAEFDARIAKP
jgi:hypothetical protein